MPKLKKLEISEELDGRIKRLLDSMSDKSLKSNRKRLAKLAAGLSDSKLDKEGLLYWDLPKLAVGDYTVKSKFEPGSLFYSTDGHTDCIFEVISAQSGLLDIMQYRIGVYGFRRKYGISTTSPFANGARPVTEAERKKYLRAEHFFKQGRRFNEFRRGDIVFDSSRGTYPYFELIDPSSSPHSVKPGELKLVCTVENRGDKRWPT
ncbi:hypothetical protein [Listeria booriae]|uniref:hypothetical protein n=1 Tax=Listeria booriae TaxID=1552123 RepID=UPI0016261ECB|nr:hypothetical protein [Listeria booriae]MBC2207441.1 hypothetical protein [Listeria booriae]